MHPSFNPSSTLLSPNTINLSSRGALLLSWFNLLHKNTMLTAQSIETVGEMVDLLANSGNNFAESW